MELKIIPSASNLYPLRGLLIHGSTVTSWLDDMQRLNLKLAEVQVYAIPDLVANSVWGCFVLFKGDFPKLDHCRHEFVQGGSQNFFISERADIFPAVTKTELDKLFPEHPHIMHPHFGMVELTEEVDFSKLILTPDAQQVNVTKPFASIKIPSQVRTFQVQPLSPEQVMESLSENVFPKHESLPDKPLNFFEKAKLSFYDTFLFKKDESGKESISKPTALGSFFKKLFGKGAAWENVQEDFEDLEKRNRKAFDKLMDLLKNNPEEALKYAIPLDENNSSRGGMSPSARFELSKRWADFSLFGKAQSGGSGGAIDFGDNFFALQNQYRATAEQLIANKEHEKAAFIYMKLLKQYDKAADTMELGNHFQEAAAIHLKHTLNKKKAAQCYEKGNMVREAIDLYKELRENEKVGDLYMTLNNKTAANEFYQRVVADFTNTNQFVKASLVYRNKMFDALAGQALLLDGWKKNADAVNCLNMFFANIPDKEKHQQAVTEIYQKNVNDSNNEGFLQVIKNEYSRVPDLQEMLREMAFEIVSSKVNQNARIVEELKHFNPENKELVKDTIRFKLKKK
jgi:hypothetical protein